MFRDTSRHKNLILLNAEQVKKGADFIKINIISIGKSMPAWIAEGFVEYSRRLPKDYQVNLIEIPLTSKRAKSKDSPLNLAETNSLIVALDEHGKEWSTLEFTKHLKMWHNHGQNVSFLIGGPDGLPSICLQKAQVIWSLSRLTLPHQLVKVFIIEQIYRAWSIINNHPYHRS